MPKNGNINVMAEINEQILEIEKEIRETPYHKGTEHHIGKLRARLSQLRDKVLNQSTKKSGGGGGYAVKKQGDATVVLVGPPSAGKSTLINKLTNAKSKVAPYAFTTVSVIPGMMRMKSAYIQILDVPGLIEGAHEGKGRGREVLSVVRAADLLVIMSDLTRVREIEEIKKTLENNGVRINKARPKVNIEKKLNGGISIHTNIRQDLDNETIKEIARDMGIKNAEISINEKITMDSLIDAFSRSRVYVPAIFILNKADMGAVSDSFSIDLLISASEGVGLPKLQDLIWQSLNFVEVFLVRGDEEPSFKNPMIMKTNNTLKDVALKIGSDFLEDKKRAKIWNSGAKFPGQEVSLNTRVQEGMQVRFV